MRFLTLVLLLPLAACGGPGRDDPRNDTRGLDRDETLVRTTGTARAEARPDEARFSAGVTAIGATGPEAGAANAKKMGAVVAALKALGVAEADIQTQQLSIARQDYGPNRNKFEANNVVGVRIRKVDQAGAIIAAATGAGANVLSGPDLRVGDPDAAIRRAYADAYRSARARADAYAAAAGLKVARILTISDSYSSGGIEQQDARYAREAMAANQQRVMAAPPPVMAGTSEATVAVSVDFALSR